MKKTSSVESDIYSKEQLHLGHLNHMAGVSYDIGHPILQLRVVASSCFFGEPKYYEDRETPKLVNTEAQEFCATLRKSLGESLLTLSSAAQTPAQAVEQVIDEALAFSIEATLQEAVRLRQEEGMRTTPQVILVRAANHPDAKGTGLITKYAPAIVQRLDETAVGLQYQVSQFGKPIPNSLKKAWAKKLESATELALSKYRLENKEVKLVDVVNLVHAKSESINKLMRGELKLEGKTWESYISENGSDSKSWTHASSIMGHTALLRNIRNFVKNNVEPAAYLTALVNTAEKQGEMPFRYYSAYLQVKSLEKQIHDRPIPTARMETQFEQKLKAQFGAIEPSPENLPNFEAHQGKNTFNKIYKALETCVQIALQKTPQFEGKVMSLCDNSGSAQSAKTSELGSMKVSSIANLTAVMTGLVSEEGFIGVFGDNLKLIPVAKDKNVFEQVQNADNLGQDIGHGTENGVWLFFDKAIKERQHWDHIFIYSDMQAGHGGLYGTNPEEYKDYLWANEDEGYSRRHYSQYIDVAKLVKKYRDTVNPNVRVYMVQVAGYKDTLVPEFYKKTYIMGGWGSGLLNFAHYMQRIDN